MLFYAFLRNNAVPLISVGKVEKRVYFKNMHQNGASVLRHNQDVVGLYKRNPRYGKVVSLGRKDCRQS